MQPITRRSLIGSALATSIFRNSSFGSGSPDVPQGVKDIGSRWEPFIDEWLIEKRSGVEMRLNTPERREIVFTTDRPWEGPSSAYFTVLQDGKRIRLYYRGFTPADGSDQQVTCLAESEDGVHFTRPDLGLFEFQGSKQNNIVWKGVESHNFAPFLDGNPDARANARYKALAGLEGKLLAFRSPDGVRWSRLQDDPVITKGAFDSLNLGFWDTASKQYRCYSRFFTDGVRAIQSCTSPDFVNWTQPVPNRYAPSAPKEHFYTNATIPCPGAPHLLLSFPKRFVPERTKMRGYKEPGVSDAILMTSRNGLDWDRTFLDAWVRPGLDQKNWTQRSNMPAWGCIETAPGELSFYISEHYEWPDHRIRRIVLPKHRFASIHAGGTVGEVVTKPFVFSGTHLVLNYSTSAAGWLAVEIQDEQGKPIPGFEMAKATKMFGDSLEEALPLPEAFGIHALQGKPVRLRVQMRDADLFAIRFGSPAGLS